MHCSFFDSSSYVTSKSASMIAFPSLVRMYSSSACMTYIFRPYSGLFSRKLQQCTAYIMSIKQKHVKNGEKGCVYIHDQSSTHKITSISIMKCTCQQKHFQSK